MKIISKSLDETSAFAKDLLKKLKDEKSGEGATVLALDGDLGSGKTTFSQYLGQALGVGVAIQSPTFLIERIYELEGAPWQHLIHIDTYRLEDPTELLNLGWGDIIKRPENIILVEWADRAKSILPQKAYHVVFKHGQSENEREIEVRD